MFFLSADLHACTKGENQTPTHYAAKNDAAKALKVLLKLGGRMEDRDYKQRTPLQVAAELGRVIYWIKTGKFLNMSVVLLSCYCHSAFNNLSIFDSFIISPKVLIRTKPGCKHNSNSISRHLLTSLATACKSDNSIYSNLKPAVGSQVCQTLVEILIEAPCFISNPKEEGTKK